jgi:drug/metabolite transporter (DMT)-like permease
MALVPITIILPSALIFKEKITFYQVLGAFVSVAGCVLLFLK